MGKEGSHGYWPTAAAAAAAFGALTLVVSRQGPTDVDREVLEGVSPETQSPLLDLLPAAAPAAALAVSAMAAAARWRHGDRASAAFCLASPVVVTAAATWLLKPLIARPWLDGTDYAFPSGHTTMVVAAWTTCFVALRQELDRPGAPVLAALAFSAASGLAATVPVGLVLLRHHFLTDVVGGALLALSSVLASAGALEAARRSR